MKSFKRGILIKGTLNRGLTATGACLQCATLGIISIMLMNEWEKEKGEDLTNLLDNTLGEIEMELNDKISEEKIKNLIYT